MNSNPPKLRSQHSLKSELMYSIPVCMLSAHVFVSYLQEENFFNIFFKPGYTPAVLASFIIAIILILIVKYITRYFDKKQPWYLSKYQRLWLQFFYGFFFTLLIEFGMSSAYFGYYGYHITETEWIKSYALPIALFILILNLYYNSSPPLPVTSENNDKVAPTQEVPVNDEPTPPVLSAAQLRILDYAMEKDVMYISISDKKTYAKDSNGQPVLWHDSLSESTAALPKELYYYIGRKYIIHRDIIDHLEPNPKNHILIIVLKDQFNKRIDVPDQSIFHFEEWYHKKSV